VLFSSHACAYTKGRPSRYWITQCLSPAKTKLVRKFVWNLFAAMTLIAGPQWKGLHKTRALKIQGEKPRADFLVARQLKKTALGSISEHKS
jgi:hypothetical protein